MTLVLSLIVERRVKGEGGKPGCGEKKSEIGSGTTVTHVYSLIFYIYIYIFLYILIYYIIYTHFNIYIYISIYLSYSIYFHLLK